jgi:hypothetical protein
MSAELLRRAAALMRERAGTLPAGPWRTSGNSDDQSFVQDAEQLLDVEVHVSDGYYSDFAGTVRAAEHIASWHPAVALAVADWLDYQANYGHLTRHISGSDAPERVARAYLGEVES